MPADQYLARLREMLVGATFNQRFGCTGFYLEGAYKNCPHFHKGIDFTIAGGLGADIYSPASGVVVPSTARGLGNSIEILAPNGFRYIIGHMQHATHLKVGDPVLAGQFIGQQGSTGASTGAHVHLQIMSPAGEPINPTPVQWNSWTRLWYTLFHSLGAGAGYNPGQSIAIPPDPFTPGYGGTVVPVPLPNGEPATWEFAGGQQPPDPLPDPGGTADPYQYQTTGYDTGSIAGLFSFLNAPGGVIGQALSGNSTPGGLVDTATGSGIDCASVALMLSLAGLGVIVVIVGLLAITKEEPAQTVIQPVVAPISDAATTGAKLAGTAAKAGA